MRKSEIKVGGRYAAKVNGRVVIVRVLRTYEVTWNAKDATRYDVLNETTGRKTTFRSATKFRSEVSSDARPTSPTPAAGSAATAPSAVEVSRTSAVRVVMLDVDAATDLIAPSEVNREPSADMVERLAVVCRDYSDTGESQGGVTCNHDPVPHAAVTLTGPDFRAIEAAALPVRTLTGPGGVRENHFQLQPSGRVIVTYTLRGRQVAVCNLSRKDATARWREMRDQGFTRTDNF